MEFNFEDIMNDQIDGVSMGSTLGLALANFFFFFFGYYESLLCKKFRKPYIYIWYVDDTFPVFDTFNQAAHFHQRVNSLHSFLVFTM